jgi:hypothetical protein
MKAHRLFQCSVSSIHASFIKSKVFFFIIFNSESISRVHGSDVTSCVIIILTDSATGVSGLIVSHTGASYVIIEKNLKLSRLTTSS